MARINVPNLDKTGLFSNYKPPNGEFLCEVVDEPLPRESSKGTPQLQVRLRIVAAKDPRQSTEEGQQFTDFITYSVKQGDESKNFRLKGLFVSAGLIERDDTTSEIARGDIDLAVLVGTKPNVKITRRMYEQKEQIDVEYLLG